MNLPKEPDDEEPDSDSMSVYQHELKLRRLLAWITPVSLAMWIFIYMIVRSWFPK